MPKKLAAAFKKMPRRQVFVPPTSDEAILRAAEKHLQRPEPKGRFWRLLRWPGMVFAAVVLLVCVIRFFPHQSFAAEDLNRDGSVDILDVFQLARELPSNAERLDLNGDGRVDDRDVDVLARRVVQLDREERS